MTGDDFSFWHAKPSLEHVPQLSLQTNLICEIAERTLMVVRGCWHQRSAERREDSFLMGCYPRAMSFGDALNKGCDETIRCNPDHEEDVRAAIHRLVDRLPQFMGGLSVDQWNDQQRARSLGNYRKNAEFVLKRLCMDESYLEARARQKRR